MKYVPDWRNDYPGVLFMTMSFTDKGKLRQTESCFPGERGIALVFVLLALAILSLLGLFMALEATTGLHISDNYESRIRATYAALAGLNHARALMRGLDNDAFLQGPDGIYEQSSSYLKQAKKFSFRNPLPLVTAHFLNLMDPEQDVSAMPDDGMINTGSCFGNKGTPLIPLTGIALQAPNPTGPGEIVISRYFVKVTDNNGEASEITRDTDDSPFIDGDGMVIIRSMGIAKTFSDRTGSVTRRNSVVVFEARYRRFTGFDSGSAMLVLGSRVLASLGGNYEIAGGLFPGIGVIDTDVSDTLFPAQIIGAGPLGNGNISGAGLPNPSIVDITDRFESDPERSIILNPQYLWNFVFSKSPQFSDNYYNGDQFWDPIAAPNIGCYDSSRPFNAPGQDPKLTVVHGNLRMAGNLSGGGLLIVTGDFECVDACQYDGLVLVIGSGRTVIDIAGKGLTGGIVVANLVDINGIPCFGVPDFYISGDSRITADDIAVKTALGLIPPVQTSFREVTGVDP
jgi:hypothetical protein